MPLECVTLSNWYQTQVHVQQDIEVEKGTWSYTEWQTTEFHAYVYDYHYYYYFNYFKFNLIDPVAVPHLFN